LCVVKLGKSQCLQPVRSFPVKWRAFFVLHYTADIGMEKGILAN